MQCSPRAYCCRHHALSTKACFHRHHSSALHAAIRHRFRSPSSRYRSPHVSRLPSHHNSVSLPSSRYFIAGGQLKPEEQQLAYFVIDASYLYAEFSDFIAHVDEPRPDEHAVARPGHAEREQAPTADCPSASSLPHAHSLVIDSPTQTPMSFQSIPTTGIESLLSRSVSCRYFAGASSDDFHDDDELAEAACRRLDF